MSLLQEALKRKEEDNSQSRPEAGSAETMSPPVAGQQADALQNSGAAPDAPPQSMPVAEQTPAAPGHGMRKSPTLWIIVAVIAVSAMAITAGIAFRFSRVSPSAKAKAAQQAGPAKAAAVAAPGTNLPAGQPLPVTAPGTKPESAGAAPAPAQNAETNAVRPQPAATAESKPATAKPAFSRSKAPAASQAARWPTLKLTGILRGTGKTESSAFINGKLVSAGQTIAEVTVVEIQADGIILKYGNESRFLRVGATSY